MKRVNFLILLFFGILTFVAIYYFLNSNKRDYSQVQNIVLNLNDSTADGLHIAYEFRADHLNYQVQYTTIVKNEKQVIEKELSHEKYSQLLKMLYLETAAKDQSLSNAQLLASDTTYYLLIDNENDYIQFLK
jgi:hypothetical protein